MYGSDDYRGPSLPGTAMTNLNLGLKSRKLVICIYNLGLIGVREV